MRDSEAENDGEGGLAVGRVHPAGDPPSGVALFLA
jgi:hypothetical protein